jgi:hypothetical protein
MKNEIKINVKLGTLVCTCGPSYSEDGSFEHRSLKPNQATQKDYISKKKKIINVKKLQRKW